MEDKYFRYKNHPGDLLRNTDIIKLPDPDKDLEEFLIWFLADYQSDFRIAYLDDLYKILENEFISEKEKLELLKTIGLKNNMEIQEEIHELELELKNEAYKNFYHLLLENKIEVLSKIPKHHLD